MFLLSRAEAHGVPLRREFLHFDEVVADSARAVRVLADQRGVTVTIDGADEVGLAGDDALLRQMVGNLLDNAIRHARPDGDGPPATRTIRRPRAAPPHERRLMHRDGGPRADLRSLRAGRRIEWRRAGSANRQLDRGSAWRHAGAGGEPARLHDFRRDPSRCDAGAAPKPVSRFTGRSQIDSSVLTPRAARISDTAPAR